MEELINLRNTYELETKILLDDTLAVTIVNPNNTQNKLNIAFNSYDEQITLNTNLEKYKKIEDRLNQLSNLPRLIKLQLLFKILDTEVIDDDNDKTIDSILRN